MEGKPIERRQFLKYTAAATTALTLTGFSPAGVAENPTRKWRKALKYSMLPKELPDEEKFNLARRCGFGSGEQFCRAFRRTTGVAPGDFRRARADSPD